LAVFAACEIAGAPVGAWLIFMGPLLRVRAREWQKTVKNAKNYGFNGNNKR
jgi:hypothetical protein